MFAALGVFALIASCIQFAHGAPPAPEPPMPSSYDNICSGAGFGFYGKIWFAAHPKECDKYIQCHRNELYNTVVGEEMQCAFSTYWDNILMSCVGVGEANCLMDPCRDIADYNYHYNANGNCRGYWQCNGGQSVAKCCNVGETFDSNKGCVEDYSTNCNDACFNDVVPLPEACDKRETANKYVFEQLSNGEWFQIECAPGSTYVQSMCGCAMFADTLVVQPPAPCTKEIYLPFDTDTNDQSGNSYSILNTGVQVRNGSAIFDGTGQLLIPRFNNLDHITSIRINVKYTSNPAAGRTTAIVSNNAGTGHSILITENSGSVDFACKTTGAPNGVELSLPQDSYAPQPANKDVTFNVNNGMFSCLLGQSVETKDAPGTLQTVKCGLQIGHSDSLANFVGEIDEVTVYLCNPNNF